MCPYRLVVSLFIVSSMIGCSTAPKVADKKFLSSYEKLERHKEKSNYSDQRYVDKEAIKKARTLNLGSTAYENLILPDGIDVKQIALVANAVDRELCGSLSSYFEIVDEQQPADLNLRSALTAVRPTNKKAAVASAVLGQVSPFWVRPPAGMGALAGEAELLDSTQQQKAAIVWARGAGSFSEDESISSIGDAYQLAERFANDLVKLIVEGRKKTKNAKEIKKSNEEKCVARYGKSSMLGKIGSMFLPLSPESKDSGKPNTGAVIVQPIETTEPAESTEENKSEKDQQQPDF
jgi:Protein of unknown function (DUF3313)